MPKRKCPNASAITHCEHLIALRAICNLRQDRPSRFWAATYVRRKVPKVPSAESYYIGSAVKRREAQPCSNETVDSLIEVTETYLHKNATKTVVSCLGCKASIKQKRPIVGQPAVVVRNSPHSYADALLLIQTGLYCDLVVGG